MARRHWPFPRPALAALALLAALPACTVQRVVDTPAYSQASPYAAPAYAPGYSYAGAPAAPQPYDSYCAEAVGEAQSAAAQASVTGTGLDANRAQRTAEYARRDC